MNSLRNSYEARVLLVPLGRCALELSAEMAVSGLDGVMTMTVDRGATTSSADLRPLGRTGWAAATSGRGVADVVTDADMVVLLAADLAEVPIETCIEISGAAHGGGVLIAALVVGPENSDVPMGKNAMAALRESVDMLVVLRGLGLATPFIDVLRGGPRQHVPTA